MHPKLWSTALLPALLLAASACTPRLYLWPTGQTATPNAQPSTGLANPASNYCRQNNGQVFTRRDNLSGETGYCIFTDRSYCEEWSYYRADCKPGDNADFQSRFSTSLPTGFP